jgi:hypothetical protein
MYEPQSALTRGVSNGFTDTRCNQCAGPYESAGGDETLEASDALCYPKGDTHGQLNTAPDTVAGCEDNLFQNGDPGRTTAARSSSAT